MELNKQSVEQILSEQSGPRVLICCEDHQFYPDSKLSMPMQEGCKYCVMAQLMYDFSMMPASVRQERLDQLEQLVHHMAEDIDAGRLNFELFDNPKVEFSEE